MWYLPRLRKVICQTREYVTLKISPCWRKFVLDKLKAYFVKLPNFKNPIQHIDEHNDENKMFVFQKTILQKTQIIHEIEQTLGSKLMFDKKEFTLGYENMQICEVYNLLLPENIVHPSSFQTIGHIAHLNLREEQLPWKNIIGKIIMDKNPVIKTVVNKVKAIENKFRNAELEILAGIDDFDVTVKEQSCRFKFNYKKVYWNSKLEDEHRRIVKSLPENSVLVDVFAGVGPFSIPAAVTVNCSVYANDANPDSVDALKSNCKLNKVEGRVNIECMDAKEYIHWIVDRLYSSPKDYYTPVIFVMNLPATAVLFLRNIDDAYGAHYSFVDISKIQVFPTIYCYCFVKNDLVLPTTKTKQEIEDSLGSKGYTLIEFHSFVKNSFHFLPIKDVSMHLVRKVAPNKSMYCAKISFGSKSENDCQSTCKNHPSHDYGLNDIKRTKF